MEWAFEGSSMEYEGLDVQNAVHPRLKNLQEPYSIVYASSPFDKTPD